MAHTHIQRTVILKRKAARRLIAAGIVALFATTFAAFDWIMSLNPVWFSTMFGVYFFAACCAGGFSLIGDAARSLLQQTDMIGVTPRSVVNDYPGRHLLAVLPIHFGPRLPPYGLISRRHRVHSSAMQTFVAAVRAEQARQNERS